LVILNFIFFLQNLFVKNGLLELNKFFRYRVKIRKNMNMKVTCLGLIIGLAVVCSGAENELVKLRRVSFTDVQIRDNFWLPKQETNRIASIPVNLENLVKAGNVKNFELAAAGKREGYQGPVFMDSDLYKALEAASYSLAIHPDPQLDKRLDEIIEIVAKAQQPDGYLNTYFTVVAPDKRWTNLRDWHELYCAGHLFEAAVAHYQATGKRTLLNVAIKLADNIDSVFGPGKRMGYPGHPEIELALIKLWRVTGEQRYFNLARFFIENRGKKFFAEEHKTPLDRYDGSYWQDDVPIFEHKNIKGHAVRAAYLMSGATDVAAEINSEPLLKMLNRVWRNTVYRNLYITGGIGPSAHNEGFTEDYDLPNLTAYQETCASVALAQWNHRMALLYGDSKYVDVYERSLYNGVLAGVSYDGKKFFYVNPLESKGNHHRSPWFGCACCPPNVARTLASLGEYAYAASDNGLWVNLYIQGSVSTKLKNGQFGVKVVTDYPWDGNVSITPVVDKPAEYELRLRVPGWCSQYTVSLNKKKIESPVIERGYIVLKKEWRSSDRIDLNFEMPVLKMMANPRVKADHGLIALQRGPIVYCVEACDHDLPLNEIYLTLDTDLKPVKTNLFNGIVTLQGNAYALEEMDWQNALYKPIKDVKRVKFTAIPYYAWDNRKAGPMRVWHPLAPPVPQIKGLEGYAKVTMSFVNWNCQPEGINDGIEPKKSSDQPAACCHWWDHKGTEEWVQYEWKNPVVVAGSKVYWFDDTGRGECRIPESWKIMYLDNGQWKPVQNTSDYVIKKDQWCEVRFNPIKTTALRLVVKMQPNWAAGVHEWKVIEAED
jgi:DUF1680 family protein